MTHVLITLRLVKNGKEDKTIYDMSKFIRGEYPDEVHILLDPREVNQELIHNKHEFDKDFYDKFKDIDNSLNLNLNQWDQEYDHVKITPSWKMWGWFCVLMCSLIAPLYFYNNYYYLSYLGAGVLFYYIKAFFTF